MARTTRIPDATASAGGVRQHGGSLPVYRCNSCNDEVVWVESKRTGRPYLVNVRRGHHDQRFYIGIDFHPRDCAARRAADIEAWEELATHEDDNHRLTGKVDGCSLCDRGL